MPAFVSKLQCGTCEKGEYYEEQVRTLEETLELINNFPWHNWRFAEIDLTGPSVTILNSNNEILKVGIHYGGTFHIYFLDNRNRFYERYPVGISDVEDMVTDFYKGELKLSHFGGGSYGYLKRQYFLTQNFNYSVNPWGVFLSTFWICLAGLMFLVPLILSFFLPQASSQASITQIFLAVPATLTIAIPCYCFVKMGRYKGQHLHITRANNEFTFGDRIKEVKTYDKGEITKIITIVSKNSREPVAIKFMQIIFNDDTSISFSSLLISPDVLKSKFPQFFKPEWVTVEKWILAEL